MKQVRYWLSSLFLEWGVRLIPDEYPRIRVQMAIGTAADVMMAELSISEDEEDVRDV